MDQVKAQGLARQSGRLSNIGGQFMENPWKVAMAVKRITPVKNSAGYSRHLLRARESGWETGQAAGTQKARGVAVSRWIFVFARSDVGQGKAMPDHPAKIIRCDWLQQMMIETRGLSPLFHVIA
jgi:hypothetical protein